MAFHFGDKVEVIHVRLTSEQLEKVDRLAAILKTTRSDLLRAMVESAVSAVDVDKMEQDIKGVR